MLDAMEFAQCTPSLSQALRIKKLSADTEVIIYRRVFQKNISGGKCVVRADVG